MDFFSRITPVYKRANVMQGATARVQSAAPSGLSGLIGSLFGSTTPAYKTAPAATAAATDDFGVDDGACVAGPDEIAVL
jgi:hypothetical protein